MNQLFKYGYMVTNIIFYKRLKNGLKKDKNWNFVSFYGFY